IAKIVRTDCLPVDLVKISEIIVENGVSRPGIAVAENPAYPRSIGPCDRLCNVNLQMYNRSLSPTIGKFWVITHTKNIKHDRARTKVEGNVVPDLGTGMTRYG